MLDVYQTPGGIGRLGWGEGEPEIYTDNIKEENGNDTEGKPIYFDPFHPPFKANHSRLLPTGYKCKS